jgi:Pyridoxamine 5'-phosphate oxidase
MDALATPTAAPPVLYGAPAPPGDLLPWSWAEQQLVTARHYWIATTRPDGRPHCRPVWGVWLPDGFWFSTGSLARHNLLTNPQITVHLESGDQVVIVEGVAAAMTGRGGCRRSWPPTTRNTTGTPPPTTRSPTRRGLPGRPSGCGPGSSSAGTPTCERRPAGPSPTPPPLWPRSAPEIVYASQRWSSRRSTPPGKVTIYGWSIR